jgi:DsbC/DsbD-like thiol-disulfide interchange protein
MVFQLTGHSLAGGICAALLLLAGSPCAAQSGLAHSVPGGVAGASGPGWVKGHNSAVRLISGAMPGPGASVQLLAGVELRLADGWKTYWRHPGDDGGLPPSFDWTGSKNLKSATVRYPVPARMKSLNGTALGYAKAVVFPVEIAAEDPTRAVDLMLTLEYGICREICIPAEAKLQLRIATSTATLPPDLAGALAKIPQSSTATPLVKSAKAVLSGPQPAITFDIAAAEGARVDLFAETMEGSYLPVPKKVGDATSGVQRFSIDLKGVEDAAKLAGKPLRLTVTGVTPAIEMMWTVK